jgi:hypothetical protein
MRTFISGLVATAMAATAALAVTAPAKADRMVYYGDPGHVYRVDSDRSGRWQRWHRHHRPHVRYYNSYDSYDPYYYRSYHGFGSSYYGDPYYPRHYGWRHYHRPGVSIQLGF